MSLKIKETFSFEKFKSKKTFALLIDPDKFLKYDLFINNINKYRPDFIFVGGSQNISKELFNKTIKLLKSKVDIPLIIFPGNNQQIHPEIDALLVLSLLNASHPDYISGQLLRVATIIKESKINTIPVSYILVDGGKISTTQKFIKNTINPIKNSEELTSIVSASDILGFKTIYLEAGSGALYTVDPDFVRISKTILQDKFLIVGGGIKNTISMNTIWNAGADCIVVGNAIENNPELIIDMCLERDRINQF